MRTDRKRYSIKSIFAVCIFVSLIMVFIGSTANIAIAQSDLIIYPKEGQSEKQQEKDKYECYTWAKKQTGFDPMEVPKATEPPPQQEAKKGGVGKGAVRGGLVGLGVGAIAGDAGKGAAIGAAAGGLFGGMRRQDQKRQQEQAEQQWAQEQSSQYAHNRNNYNRAYAACLEARSYNVK
jgi:hypothetical protein